MYSELGDKVKLLRNRRGLKQDDLAVVLELSRSQISTLESGRRNLSLKQLEKLCEYFQVDMSYFVMSETTDSCLDLIEKAKLLFASKELTNIQKEDLFVSIMKVNDMVAKITLQFVILITNYLLSKLFVFRKKAFE